MTKRDNFSFNDSFIVLQRFNAILLHESFLVTTTPTFSRPALRFLNFNQSDIINVAKIT